MSVTQSHELIGGLRYDVEEAGAGEPLVLLHGFTGRAANWRPLLTRLAEQWRGTAFALPRPRHSGAPAPAAPHQMRHPPPGPCPAPTPRGAAPGPLGGCPAGRGGRRLTTAPPPRAVALPLSGRTPPPPPSTRPDRSPPSAGLVADSAARRSTFDQGRRFYARFARTFHSPRCRQSRGTPFAIPSDYPKSPTCTNLTIARCEMSAPTTEKKPAAHKQNGAQTPKHDEDLHVTREQLLDLLGRQRLGQM